jgi:phage/plasmid-like protein (TIGR03299 family)
MSANVEQIAYVSNEANGRFTPWHGLGTPVAEAMTSAEALRLGGLDWEVNPKPVFTETGLEIPNYKANTRSSDNSVLGIVTDRYKVVQNKDAFAFTDALIEEGGVRYETAGSLRNGKTIWLLAKMPEKKILDDKFDPYICFTNSHDGTGAVKVCCTPIRVVCQNTLNMALSSASRSWSTKHVGDMAYKLEEARQTLKLANNYMAKLDEEADKLANMKISEDEIHKILDEMFPINEDKDSDRKKANVENAKNEIMICYMAPDIAKFLGTKYGFLNAVSDWVGHSTPARNTASYRENNWGRIIDGHPIFDLAYNLCTKSA